jgi:hypothetical protein
MLVHATTYKNAIELLRSGYLEPNTKTGKERYDEKFNTTFMSVLFDDMKFVDNNPDVLLFFDIETMKRINPKHWTSVWNYGEFSDEPENGVVSVKYDKHKSPSDNIKVWKEVYGKIYTKKKDYVFDKNYNKNEVVFPRRITLKDNLVAIYYTGSQKLEDDKLITKRSELMKLLNKV